MKLSIGMQIIWRCSQSSCRSEVNIRVGNWLEGSHIPIVTIVRFIYAWAIGMTAVNNKFCERELEMNSKTRTDWNNNLSSICVEHVVNKQKNQGGENVNVEIHRNRAEFMCRQEVKKEDFFEWILNKIAEIRPPK
uniref:Candidate secreted effector n=1 Tax=Meloidogyne incognita TaxID=6306 RepID=A0A914KZ94_MELIC